MSELGDFSFENQHAPRHDQMYSADGDFLVQNGEHHHHHHSGDGGDEHHKHRHHKKTWQRILLKLIPIVIFFVAFYFICLWAFNAFVVNNPYWALIVSDGSNINTNSGELNNDVADVTVGLNNGKLIKEQFPALYWGDKFAKISIPVAGVENVPIYLGDSTKILDQMVVGMYFGSTYPGEAGKTVLSSHVSAAFHCIEDLEVGDQIIVNTIYGEYVYEVTEFKIFESGDVDVILPDEDTTDRLVCYTCYPRDAAFRSQRIAAIATRVSGTPWEE